jgi:hypothetical protein
VDRVLDDLNDRAYEEAGDTAEDFPDLPKEKQDELAKLVGDWLDANVQLRFWSVENVKPITVTAEMIREHGFEVQQ